MHFFLSGHSKARNHTIPISESERDTILGAKDRLLRVLSIEEKFDMLAENYDELEDALERIARRSAVFGRGGWGSGVADIHLINRRLNNFMSTARLYLDQVDNEMKSIYGAESDERKRFNAVRSEEYDSRLGYRALEQLRNYAQHAAIPVHGLTHDINWKEEDGKRFIVHRVRAYIDLRKLREEGFHKKTLVELEAQGEHADLRPLVRDYMTGLYAVHRSTRAAVEPVENQWRTDLHSAKLIVHEKLDDPDARVYEVFAQDNEDNLIRSDQVFEEFLERLDELRAKNQAQADLTISLRAE
jgi:hypothetical protein